MSEQPEPRRVAVLTHVGRDLAIETACRFIEGLTIHGLQCLVPTDDLAAVREQTSAEVHPLDLSIDSGAQGCELAVVFGGDGSILRGAEWAVVAQVPVLGVNLGHVGFLAEAESTEIDTVVSHVLASDWSTEERTVIEVSLVEPGATAASWTSFAVNEVSLEKAARERMLEVLVEVDRHPLSRWNCDGVLVATPTGSTAYAFSAGGPVMWPEVEALLLVPLSAHALFSRPLVLGPSSEITVTTVTHPPTTGVLWCDGRRSVPVPPGARIEVQRSDLRLRLARLGRYPFTDRLVHKFGLRVEGWRGAAEQRDRDRLRSEGR